MRMVRNPRALTDLWDGREIGDPFLMRFDGKFYLYCSSHGNAGIKCWISEDLEQFEYYGYVCEDRRVSGAYAPEVAYNAGKFWMVTSPVGSGHYLLRADGPLGPFEIVSDNLGISIDGSLFVDDDGRSWFYRASHQGIRAHAMPDPGTIDVRSTPIPASFLGHWTEGPQVIKREGRYFLTDTGNHVLSRGYRVDYCVSHDGPVEGYHCLRDKTLLLETRDEFHALGHSSSCMGPDMDTYYIIYHKNILDERNRPLHRSMNIDRFFFNGDRMYTNATWWRQPAPEQPVCDSRAGEGLVGHALGLALPVQAGPVCSAEWNIRLTEEQGTVFFCANAQGHAALTLFRNGAWHFACPDAQAEGHLPTNVDTTALITVRLSLRAGRMLLFVNGMHILERQTDLAGGSIGIGRDCAPSYIGFSRVAQGSSDGVAPKSVPGAFDAVHQLGDAGQIAQGETGCAALKLRAGETASYALNVWRAGAYYMTLTVREPQGDIPLLVNGVPCTAQAPGMCAGDGMARCYCGVVELPAGLQTLTLAAEADITVDRMTFVEADAPAFGPIIENGQDVTSGALRPTGHKAAGSMHHKFSGYTAAEGYGEAWYGGSWRDMELRMVIRMCPCSPDARVSAYVRSSRESWHPHQVSASRRAYALRITANKMQLFRQDYGEELLAEAPVNVEWGGLLSLTLRVRGSHILVLQDGAPVMAFTDPMALPCGRVGIDAICDGMGFESLALCPAGE